MNEAKPGVKTTEFWITVAPVIMALIEGKNATPEQTNILIIAGSILGGLYLVSRTIVKMTSKKS
jgi:hypothetical protein